MNKPLNRTIRDFAQVLGTAVLVAVSLFTLQPGARAGCGCMDIALVVDDTGSMGGAIANVKAGLPQIIATAQAAGGGDVRFGLVTIPSDNVVVNQPFTSDIASIQSAIQALVATGGNGAPESSDEAVQYVVTGAADATCTVSNAPFGAFRPACTKIAVLITDAYPGGCADAFTPGVSDVHAHQAAVAAANAGVIIGAIYVPTGTDDPVISAIMQDYAVTSGGTFVLAGSDGSGTGQGLADAIAKAGGTTAGRLTRSSRFWFTHAYYGAAVSTNCLSLLDAIKINGSVLDIGFTNLPTAYWVSGGGALDANDTLVEALSFYWRNQGKTGEGEGTQNQGLNGSPICRARKQLAVELIAATANVKLLGADPTLCRFFNGSVTTNFSANLLAQARQAAQGTDPVACTVMTALLRKFNGSGVTNDLGCYIECSANPAKTLRGISRDPTTHFSCPGLHDTCASAEAVGFPSSGNPCAPSTFVRTGIDTRKVSSGIVYWEIPPALGGAGRRFTATTAKSNFAMNLTVLEGQCAVISSNGNLTADTGSLSFVAGFNTNSIASNSTVIVPKVSFTTDGSNTFYIEATPAYQGAVGKLKITVTSP